MGFREPKDKVPVELRLRTDEERKQLLREYVIGQVSNGSRIELQDNFSAVLVSGKTPNHILHLLLSVVTFGFWILVWIFLIFTVKIRTYLCKIDEFGVITEGIFTVSSPKS